MRFIDPHGLEIRVYSSNAFGIPGLNHSYVYSTETGMGHGRDGLSGRTWGDGVKNLNNPYTVVTNTMGMSEKEFMDKINAYPGWNTGMWAPWFNDCHTDLEKAFEHAKVPYPGAPNARVDIDDLLRSRVNSIVDEIKQAIRARFMLKIPG